MQLHYCANLANFGDQINPWLWSRLIPDLLHADDRTLLLGMRVQKPRKARLPGRIGEPRNMKNLETVFESRRN